MVIRVRLNVRGVHHNIFTTNQPSPLAFPDDTIKNLPEYLLALKPAATILRKGGVIRDGIIQIQPKIPAVRNVIPNLFSQLSLGVDAIKIAQKQHFNQQYRIN